MSKSTTNDINFLCHRCHQPLKLDSSFSSINKTTFNELKVPLSEFNASPSEQLQLFCEKDKEEVIEFADDAVQKTIRLPSEVSHDSANGFTLLGETDLGSYNLSKETEKMAYLFDVLSGYTEVDHPMCEECTDTLLDLLDQQLKQTEDECRDYQVVIEKMEKSTIDDVSGEQLDRQLGQLKKEEEQLKHQLLKVQEERKQLYEAIHRETDIALQLNEEEERFHHEYNDFKRQLLELEDDQKSVDAQLKYAQTQLEKLKKTNIFNATFHIWHSGHFGTINNLRLGRLPSIPVEWSEINAAWGQTVLLLYSLTKRMSFTFQRYRLVPNGNHSFIEELSDKSKELPLYCAGGIRFFWDTKFDQAMVAFLDCCQQFKEEVEKGDTGFCLPYKMDKGKIEDTGNGTSFSIKIQFNSEEQWTKALKFMLTNLKWGLAWVASQYPDT